jgi:hypothetical protein
MPTVTRDGSIIRIETEHYTAAVQTEGYVSGVMGGSFVDKATGAHDLGHGLMIADFLLEPGEDDESTPADMRYHSGDEVHGKLPKRYVELPQICTQAGRLPTEIVEADDFVALRQWFAWTRARPPYRAGSRWEQWLVFPEGARWFLAYDKITSVNTVEELLFRMDMPGHLKHTTGDPFEEIHLSYHGLIAAPAFATNFPPDERYLYQRDDGNLPRRYIRGYKITGGPWLLGMALDAGIVYEGWCHQRGYVCFIQEIGGRRVEAGGSFGSVHLVGFFGNLDEAEAIYDEHKGARALEVTREGWELVVE